MPTLLIANRGAIACRILRTARRMGWRTVAVYSEADRDSLHVRQADEAICIGPGPAAKSYLSIPAILEAAARTGADAIHPGYGFLSENPRFAEACQESGIAFVGPTPDQIRRFGLKHEARAIAEAHRVPLLPGTGILADVTAALTAAESIGYPVMLKSTAGGGGIGMRVCADPAALRNAFESVSGLARANFSDGGLFLEKFIARARHIEVQIFGDGRGAVTALGERDCSTQRRNQKVIEEAPAPGLSQTTRDALHDAARRLGAAVHYANAGTVEFLLDADTGEFYFLEVNTRLQVEHGVTEEVFGIDLVEWMIRQATGDSPDLAQARPEPRGVSIQARLYAEDPNRNFQPSCGLLTEVVFPSDARVETWVETGTEIPPFYDPMIAKIIVHAATRAEALSRLNTALADTRIHGIETNQAYLRQVLASGPAREGTITTSFLGTFPYHPHTAEVLDPGLHTLVVDWPGRVGYWDVGVPPSGPMDDRSFRLANRIVGNPPDAAGLEMTARGCTLRFHTAATVAFVGADMQAEIDGAPAASGVAHVLGAGSTLRFGAIVGNGQRTYLAVRAGLDLPTVLGSRTTFTLGKFGGHGGRILATGDVLRLLPGCAATAGAHVAAPAGPELHSDWEIAVLYGPHGAPDFFTPADIDTFFTTRWEVHYNSARTGVRLIGPKPEWARPDGGEAGLHPSNLHDNAYCVGSVDFTGDMPILLGPDGPSLGGFVCPAVIARAELWKLGQLRPGNTVRFHPISPADAAQLQVEREEELASLSSREPVLAAPVRLDPVLRSPQPASASVAVAYRRSGDGALLVEYGPMVLDLELRFRVHALMRWLAAHLPDAFRELVPGIRSLQIQYDPARLSEDRLVALLETAERELEHHGETEVPARIVHLPLSWDDPATRLAIEKYTQSVRKDAPWCPSNIEFIRRINGLDSIEEVRRIVFDASYLVLGLGDVYLGAPVATPLDPRHRLVTTKYNPARTWTPENAVGIGGAYLCIYGMEGPGGYQFVGRTVPVWNRFRQTDAFRDGKPWLLRFFDQIRFYPVEADELLALRHDVIAGRHPIRIEETTFSLAAYRGFLAENHDSIESFRATQRAAFAAERERWKLLPPPPDPLDAPPSESGEVEVPEGCTLISNHIAGNIWKVPVRSGDHVAAGDPLVIVESMKMEIQIPAPAPGLVREVLCTPDTPAHAGAPMVILEPDAGA